MLHAATTRPARCHRAFTLVEAILSTVLASVLIVSAMYIFGAAGRARQAAMYDYTGSGLANQLMTELLQCRYADPSGTNVFGPESAEITGNRSLFDDVDDYSGWTETPPRNRDGTTISGFANWRRDVAVAYINPDTMATCGTTDMGLKRVTVTVTDPRAQTVLTAVRSSNGSFDQKVTQSTTCVGWVGVSLQLGPDSSAKIVSGQSIPNIVP